MSFVVMPVFAAAEVAAPRTECALNMLVSMPALDNSVFSHLATVEEVTGLNGLIVPMRSCVLSFVRLDAVRASYSFSGQWTKYVLISLSWELRRNPSTAYFVSIALPV